MSSTAKFTGLGERMVTSIPDSRLVVIPDSGHSVHLEQPDTTVAAISEFLAG